MSNIDSGPASAIYDDPLLDWETPVSQLGDPADPYPEWKRLREQSPILVLHPDGLRVPVVHLFGYRTIEQAVKRTAELSSRINGEQMSIGERVLIAMDPPEHRVYRNLVSRSMSKSMIDRWNEPLVHKTLEELLNELEPRGRCEFVCDVARVYPTLVVARIIGLPREDWAMFRRWAPTLLAAPIARAEGLRAADEVRAYLHGFYRGDRPLPEDSLISQIMQAEIDGKTLTADEMDSFIMLLIQAGIDTTNRGLASIMWLLLDRPEVLERVRADRSLIPAAVEEGLRFEPPNIAVIRVALDDCEIGGQEFAAGTLVACNMASANRDPEVFENPDVYDIDRPMPSRHITFGTGIHTCLGIHLARLELRVGLDAILDRLPNLRHDTAEAERLGAHIRGLQFRSPTALPVTWDARSA